MAVNPIFEIIWASDRENINPINDTDYSTGWNFLGSNNLVTDHHDFVMKRFDEKAKWLHDQLNLIDRHNNLDATTDPTVNDDESEGYGPLSQWVNTASSEIFTCIVATVGAAVWLKGTLTIDELGNVALLNANAIGQNLIQLPNPGAIRFLRANADNSWSLLSAEDYQTALGLGSAATANTTATYTDTTIGLLPVIRQEGIFGLGNIGGSQNLPSTGAGSADLQTIPTGLYIALSTSFATPPFGATDVWLDVHRIGTTQAEQTAYATGTAPRKAIRTYVGGAWSPWREEWNSGNLVKTLSSTDSTLGRMLQVGDGGILSASPPSNDWLSASGGTMFHQSNTGGPAGATNVRGLKVVAGGSDIHAYASRLRRYYGLTAGPNNGNNTTWDEFYTTGNTSADVQTMLGSAGNAAIRSNIGAAKKTALVTVDTATHNIDAANESGYHRFTFNGAKSATVRPNSTHALPADGAWVLRNVGTGNLTIVAGSGVTINVPYGGTLILEPGMTVTLQKVGTNEYDLIGQTVPA